MFALNGIRHEYQGKCVLDLPQWHAAQGETWLVTARVVLENLGIGSRAVTVTVMKRGLLQIVLAALLLAAQHGALTHQVGHLQDHLPVQSQQQDDGKQNPQSGLHDFDVAFVQILGAVSSAAPPLQIAANTVENSINLFPLAFPANLVVPASRGPPVLL